MHRMLVAAAAACAIAGGFAAIAVTHAPRAALPALAAGTVRAAGQGRTSVAVHAVTRTSPGASAPAAGSAVAVGS